MALKQVPVLILCASAAIAADQEPSYNGRLLSERLGDMVPNRIWVGPSPTAKAVKAMGPNAIPTLLKWMSYEPSPSDFSRETKEKVWPWHPITNLNRSGRADSASCLQSCVTGGAPLTSSVG